MRRFLCILKPISMEDVIRAAILDVLTELGIEPVDFVVEHPNELSHGDYACNVAMVAAKRAGQNPRQFAEQIAATLEGQIEYVEKIEVAGPGFINFYLAREFFTEEIARALALREQWGTNDDLAGEIILLEYTSPNLFKPLHVGNLVGNIVGESLARLFTASGADVKRLNYPSDIGLTVAKGVWGLRATGGDPSSIKALGEAYRFGNEAYENDEAKKQEIIAVNQALYAESDSELNQLREQGIATSKASLLAICASLGTAFDFTIYESEAAPQGVALVQANTPAVFNESDGAVVYAGEKVGLHTRVFLNSKGLPTYEAKDLGNFVLKQERFPQWTDSIVVTGSEQTDYFKVVYAAINELFPEVAAEGKELEHVPTGFLTLTTGKMSSRLGNVLSGEDVLVELEQEAVKRSVAADRAGAHDATLASKVATAAIKYQILRHSVGSNIVFDKEKALSFEGDSGPYLQYTVARINSLIEKAVAVGIAPAMTPAPQTPYTLEQILYRFPEVVRQAHDERAPHHLVVFLTELAGLFNTFYGQEKIADASDPNAPYKLLLTQAVGQTIKNGLSLLGIESPEKM